MNKKRIMAILAAGVFSAVSVNPTAVMADSDTEPTTETGEMFYVDGDSTDGQMIVSEDGTPLQKTVKASEMGMSSEETLDFPFMGLSAELPDELKKIIEEKKQKEMKLTYMSGDKLYIVRGYGVQKTGGYSIQVKDLYQAKNAVYFKSELIGPGEKDVSEKVESYPYIVVSTEKTEDIVVFE